MFIDILRKQLILKSIITEQDWESWKNDITVDFLRDNHFAELKDAEVLQNRLNTLDQISSYVGEYFSREWVMKNVMMMSDEDIDQMKDQVEGENASGDDSEDDGDDFLIIGEIMFEEIYKWFLELFGVKEEEKPDT